MLTFYTKRQKSNRTAIWLISTLRH